MLGYVFSGEAIIRMERGPVPAQQGMSRSCEAIFRRERGPVPAQQGMSRSGEAIFS
jgi:hypothetical protein